MFFKIVGKIENIEVISKGRGIRDLRRIRKMYGKGKWRKLKGIATIKLENGKIKIAELHWYEAHGIGKKEKGIYKMDIKKIKFVVCINNEGYQASLELHKLYQVIPDKTVEEDGDIRIIDESGEDYIYPGYYFEKVTLKKDIKLSLLKT